jgi:formate dehydrogenase maturation protein FdhE
VTNHIGLDELAIQEGIRKPWETLLMMTKTAYGLYAFTHKDLEHLAALVAAHEREACANLLLNVDLSSMDADHRLQSWAATVLLNFSAAIRARGE